MHLAKIDIADGFYRVWLQLQDIPKLGVVLPTTPGQPPLIAFPLALPMGWVESPPFFTVLTETACDIANATLSRMGTGPRAREHRLEKIAATPPPDSDVAHFPTSPQRPITTASRSGRRPVAAVDVYVDDFLLMAQTRAHQRKVMRTTLEAIDAVFRPLMPTDPPNRKEPASVKKMLKGDAFWATHKRILGWDVNTSDSTLTLPPHRLARLYELLDRISLPHRRVSVHFWHKLLGELRSMAPALPGARGLFSVLQHSLTKADRHRVRITPHVWHMAHDFRAIADSLRDRPTRLHELVPDTPAFVGACDACQSGMGGVWFRNTGTVPTQPMLWRSRFPPSVQATLVTSDQPHGTLSISDLELAALIAHKNVLARTHDIAEQTLWMATDNRAALSWSEKGSSTSTSARAYLLRLDALQQRHFRFVPSYSHIAGKANVMADDASRLWHLSDADLLSHFTHHYPQASPWRMLTLSPETNSSLLGALFRRRPASVSLASVPPPPPPRGGSGPLSVTASPWIPRPCPPTPCPCSKCLHNNCATVPSPAVDLYGLVRWKKPFAPWARRTPAWGPLTLA